MIRYAPWKVAAIILGTLVALLLVVPSMLPQPARDALARDLPWLPARTVVLGLDLQGGAHVLLEVDAPSVVRSRVEALRDDVRRTLREGNVRLTGGIGLQAKGVQFRIPTPPSATRRSRSCAPSPNRSVRR